MEGRDTTSPRGSQQQTGHSHPFGAYFQQQRDAAGYPNLVGNPPSIIHAPTAMRHQLIPTSNPNLNNSVVPNLNPNPNNTNSVFFGDGTTTNTTSSTLPAGLMANYTERGSFSEPVKRKRGRPRKYAKDVNGTGSPVLQQHSNMPPQSPRTMVSSSPILKKKGPASGKKAQLMALGSSGKNFTPHVLTVSAGEDVSTRIITFTSQGPWAVCILSANGAISNATLRHAGVSGGAVTYEGRFEILSLTGSFLFTETSGGTRSRTGGLSVSLSGADGQVIGGGVAGLLMAASPVQVIVGTFFTDIRTNMASEVLPGVKPASMMPAGMSPSMPYMQQMRMDGMESMQEQMLGGGTGDAEHQSRPYVMPMHSIDWGTSHFDAETRDDSEPDSPSHGGS